MRADVSSPLSPMWIVSAAYLLSRAVLHIAAIAVANWSPPCYGSDVLSCISLTDIAIFVIDIPGIVLLNVLDSVVGRINDGIATITIVLLSALTYFLVGLFACLLIQTKSK